MTVSVSTRSALRGREGVVVLTPPGGKPIELSAADAFDLQRRILSASISLTHGARASTAASKAREVRRAAKVEDELRDRDG